MIDFLDLVTGMLRDALENRGSYSVHSKEFRFFGDKSEWRGESGIGDIAFDVYADAYKITWALPNIYEMESNSMIEMCESFAEEHGLSTDVEKSQTDTSVSVYLIDTVSEV